MRTPVDMPERTGPRRLPRRPDVQEDERLSKLGRHGAERSTHHRGFEREQFEEALERREVIAKLGILSKARLGQSVPLYAGSQASVRMYTPIIATSLPEAQGFFHRRTCL
jgi:hypothetical protein